MGIGILFGRRPAAKGSQATVFLTEGDEESRKVGRELSPGYSFAQSTDSTALQL
jgi:hypothetical protein